MPTHRLTDDDVAAIRKVTEGYAAAALAGDWGAWIGGFAEDAVFMPPGSPALQGLTQIRAFVENFPRLSRFTATPVQIDGCEDLAFARGQYALTVTAEAGAMTERGKFVWLWKKDPNGSWKIFQDIWNADPAN